MTDEKQTNPEQPDKPEGHTPGGQPPERVEDRPGVSQVSPEDYPLEERERH
jgi:hypothetical protein